MTGFKILSILSNLYNYLNFMDHNFKVLYNYYLEIQSWEELLKEQNNLDISFYDLYLNFSLRLLNYSATAKVLAEKCVGWRNHLRDHLSCDLSNDYEIKLNENKIPENRDYFNDLRKNFLHKRNEEATSQYTLRFKLTRSEGYSIQIVSDEINKEVIPASKDYFNAQTQFTSWFIQEIRIRFSQELKEIEKMIKQNKIGVIFNPKVLQEVE